MISAQDALKSLREGNARFASGSNHRISPENHPHQFRPIDKQEPFAIILGCSDSRVPPEIIFDQGIGDLFVIRVAGNIVTPTQIGSIELAAEQCGCRLVVVLGHTMCGAIRAAIDELEKPVQSRSANLRSIVDSISPSLEPLLKASPGENQDILLHEAMRKNVRHSVQQLRQQSSILQKQMDGDGLEVIAAEYCVSSGMVNFLGPEVS